MIKFNIMKKWDDDEIKIAIKLCRDGLKYEEIAEKLKRTKKSIKVKLNKLGYILNPDVNYEEVICGNCGNKFKSLKNENRKYCSKSCSAIVNNKLFHKRIKTNERKRKEYHARKKNNCLNCNKITTNIFCSQICQHEYKRNEIFKKIENGDTSFSHKQYKAYLIYKYGEKCMKCGWSEINPLTNKIPIELEHKDGNSENHNLNNLELLCPNHHSLTPTYGALNKGNGRTKRREKRKSFVY